jgi:hypothetical protein
LLDNYFAFVARPSGCRALSSTQCPGLLPVAGRLELQAIGNIGDGIAIRVDLYLVQSSRREGPVVVGPA